MLEHIIKILGKVLERNLRNIISINNCQFEFMVGMSIQDTVYITRQLHEKYFEKSKLYHVFIELEKAFDEIPRNAFR